MIKKIFVYTLAVFVSGNAVWAGKGVIPLKPESSAFQHVERSIALWNGHEEVIVIANDVAASDIIPVLELVPFQKKPTMRIGKVEWFRRASEIADEVFEEDECALPQLSDIVLEIETALQRTVLPSKLEVWEASSFGLFQRWLLDTLRKAFCVEELPPGFESVMLSYFNRGFRFMGVDYVDAEPIGRMVSPIEYRFLSKRFYYPLLISSANSGPISIVLLAVTHKPISISPYYGFQVSGPVEVSKGELSGLHDEIDEFFKKDTVYLTLIKFSGQPAELRFDLLSR